MTPRFKFSLDFAYGELAGAPRNPRGWIRLSDVKPIETITITAADGTVGRIDRYIPPTQPPSDKELREMPRWEYEWQKAYWERQRGC